MKEYNENGVVNNYVLLRSKKEQTIVKIVWHLINY